MNVNEAMARWPIWKLSGGKAYVILIGVWFILSWVLGPMSDTVYWLSISVSFVGPTALFCFIFARHWIGCIVAGAVTLWFAIETARAYASMNDAPRGLVWDFNMVIAPVVGGAVFLLTRAVVQRSSLRMHSA
jgi:hypothetical protein